MEDINKRKKILFITPLPPPVHGSSMVSEYIRKSTILNDAFDMDFVNLSTSRTMEEIGKSSLSLYLKKLFRFLFSYLLTIGKLIKNRYALCYLAITCHGIGFMKDVPFVLLCKIFGRKVVIHQHNKGMSSCVNRFPYKWLMPLAYKNTKVILLSERLYPDIEQVVRREQVMICPNGIPSVVDNEGVQVNNEGTPHLLYLSNLIISKGVYVLLDACKILKEHGYEFVCDFVGGETKEVTKESFEKAVIERGLEDVIRYHGPQYGSQKEMFWNKSNIFVFPTFYHNECFPLVLLEAMQHGLACVSTNEGGIPDIIENGKTGMICERNNPIDLAEKLKNILEHCSIATTMGQNSKERFNEMFILARFEKQIMQCFKIAIEGIE